MDYKWLLTSFRGRIGRQTYWMTALALFASALVLSFLLMMLGELGEILQFVLGIAFTFVSFAVAAKRWHDRNKSGWWSLIVLIPIVGPIWMLIENGFLAGTRGPNRFGPDPIGPVPVVHEGQTYFRQSDGSYRDATGNPVRDMALIGALGVAYVATQSAGSEAWSSADFDSSASSSGVSQASSSESSGGWGWGGGDSGGGDSGGGGGGGSD